MNRPLLYRFFIDIDSWYYLITSQPPPNHLLPTLNAVNQGEIM